MVNPMTLLKLKKEWELFTQRHPKFIAFLNAVQRDYIHEGSIIDITVTERWSTRTSGPSPRTSKYSSRSRNCSDNRKIPAAKAAGIFC